MTGRAFWWVTAFSIFTSPVLGQNRTPPPSDTAIKDTTDNTAALLEGYREARIRVPTVPRLGRPLLLPARSRLVFNRDTLDWHNAETVSDVLSKIPGVALLRGGWVGRPEPVNYQGRATASVEYLLDGVPIQALGPDSLSIDPSLFPLTFLEQIEVERLPGLLRVYLYTRRFDRLPPRTQVGVAAGDYNIARYQGSLEIRSRKGLGLSVAADHLAVPLRGGMPGGYENTQTWAQLSYVPNRRWSMMLQILKSGPRRKDIVSAETADTLSQGLRGNRTDIQFQLARNLGARGTRAALFAGVSRWREDSTGVALGGPDLHVRYLDQDVAHLGGEVGVRTALTDISGRIWYRSRWTPLEARATASISPVSLLTATFDGVYQRHDNDRSTKEVTGRASIQLPLSLTGTVLARAGSLVYHPMIWDEPSRDLREWAVLGAFDRTRLAGEVGYWRTDGFAPRSFPLYRFIDSIPAVTGGDWITVSGRIAPLQWLILDGWYSNSIGGSVEGQPPTHSIINLTVQSKFLPTFRSGIFGLKVQGSMETWGTGGAGRDASGSLIPLRGATQFRAQLQFKIGPFFAYYDRANLAGARLGYVPGLSVPRYASTFGIRWEFSN